MSSSSEAPVLQDQSTSPHPPSMTRIALVGSPNSGKSTLFARLTAKRAKIANYPGVTVEHHEGMVKDSEGIQLIDLPGTYSLDAISADEVVSRQILDGEFPGVKAPDAIIVVADSTTLERSLSLISEVLALGKPTLLVLTMVDELKARGGSVSLPGLSKSLGVPVVAVVGHRGVGIDTLKRQLESAQNWPKGRRMGESAVDQDSSRWDIIDGIIKSNVHLPESENRLTDRIDAVVLHPFLGPITFFAVMFLFFQALFSWSGPLMDATESMVTLTGNLISSFLPEGLFHDLIIDGVVAGVGAVVIFAPQIAMVLLIIHFFEGCGYMARAAFAVDRVMGWGGLDGRCFIALLSSYACAVPGIMSARTIPDPKSRLATILVAPFMTCSARLPVYVLFVGSFVPNATVLGVFHLQGVVFFGLYLLGAVSAFVAAALFKRSMIKGSSMPFTLELPPYRWPLPSLLWRHTWWGLRSFLRKAGTVILLASLVLWVLLTFPRVSSDSSDAANEPQDVGHISSALEQSYAGQIGHAIEPLIAPLGFDWKIGVGLVASLAAREVVISTLAQIYAVSADDDTIGLAEKMKRDINPRTGAPVYTLATVLSLLVFFVYALQCISTLAVMKRETNSYRWPAFALVSMTLIAYGASAITYQVASLVAS